MAKPFISINEQIELLKSRGLLIDDESKTRDYLLLNNYYNVVNRYGGFLTVTGTDRFIEGSRFYDLVRIHIYDKELKGIFYSKILEVESNIKSVISHTFSNAYPEQFSYLNPENYHPEKRVEAIKLISKFSKVISDNMKFKNNSIHHYMTQYNHVPLWVLVNFIYFSDISKMLSLLNEAEKAKVAHFFSNNLNIEFSTNQFRFDSNHLESYIKAIGELRNAVAHDNCMLTFKTRSSGVHNSTLHSMYGIPETKNKQDIYSLLSFMRVFLNRNQYTRLHNSVINRSKQFSKEFKALNHERVLEKCGFPISITRWSKYNTIVTIDPLQ